MIPVNEKKEVQIIEETPQIDVSRCIRRRWNRSSCDACAGSCEWQAVELHRGHARIDEARCTGCMNCVGSCKSGAIEDQTFLFDRSLRELAGHQWPVISCRRTPLVDAHTRISCLGLLSGELLLAFGLKLGKGLQLNAINCEGCPNGSIVRRLHSDIAEFKRLFRSPKLFDVSVIVDGLDLQYERKQIDRRAFFGQIGETIKSIPQTVVETLGGSDSSEYGRKAIPQVRSALNASYEKMDRANADELRKGRYYDVNVSSECDGCEICVGMCPTGALIRGGSSAPKELHFDTFRCSGCGLCAEVCPKAAITLRCGEPGMAEDPELVVSNDNDG